LFVLAEVVLGQKVKTRLIHLHSTLGHLDLTFLVQVNKGTQEEHLLSTTHTVTLDQELVVTAFLHLYLDLP
jgi:hypothetical protein